MNIATFRSLEEWDEDYLINEIAPAGETVWLEKKASPKFTVTSKGRPDAGTKEELAKQVSAFSNAGDGFLVYGIDNSGKIDDGVPSSIGKCPVNEWVEEIVPKLLFPHLYQCEAQSFRLPCHQTDRRILVVSIPLSERRPHWWVGPPETAYIRAGAHSLPMKLQTILDISSRGSASQAQIIGLDRTYAGVKTAGAVFDVQPLVRLLNGPVCQSWAFEMKVRSGEVTIEFPESPIAKIRSHQHLYIVPDDPLFPGRETPVSPFKFKIIHRQSGLMEIEASLYAGSAQPVRSVFSEIDLR